MLEISGLADQLFAYQEVCSTEFPAFPKRRWISVKIRLHSENYNTALHLLTGKHRAWGGMRKCSGFKRRAEIIDATHILTDIRQVSRQKSNGFWGKVLLAHTVLCSISERWNIFMLVWNILREYTEIDKSELYLFYENFVEQVRRYFYRLVINWLTLFAVHRSGEI